MTTTGRLTGWPAESKWNEGTSWHLATTLAGYVGISIKSCLFAATGSLIKLSGGEVRHQFQKQEEEDIHMLYSGPAGKQHTQVALWHLSSPNISQNLVQYICQRYLTISAYSYFHGHCNTYISGILRCRSSVYHGASHKADSELQGFNPQSLYFLVSACVVPFAVGAHCVPLCHLISPFLKSKESLLEGCGFWQLPLLWHWDVSQIYMCVYVSAPAHLHFGESVLHSKCQRPSQPSTIITAGLGTSPLK